MGLFDDLIPQSQPTERITVTPVQRAFLNSMSAGEAPNYNTMYGGGRFEEMADHPRQNIPIRSGPNVGKTSSAAGRYQFLGSTWDQAKTALGLPDFSPDSQDAAAVWLAERDYKNRTKGRNLWEDLESAKDNPAKLNFLGGALSGTWTSLPGGIEPNRASAGFGQRFANEIRNSSQPPTDVSAQSRISGIFDDLIPQSSQVSERFGQFEQPANADRLREGLNRTALDMTRGKQLSPSAQMAGQMANLVPAASQGTNPHIENYGGKLVSTEVFEDDGGNILYRDPQTGIVKPTDKSKQVAIRDPSDGVVKVFERSETTNEGAVTGVARVLGPGLAAGAPTARAAISASNKVVPTASETMATAKPFYRAFDAEAKGIPIPPQAAEGYVNRVKQAMDSANVPEHLAGEVYRSVERIAKGDAVTPEHLRSVKELIGQSSRSADSRVRQAAGVANKEINKIISELSRTAGENLKTADSIYATAKTQQDLQRKASVADLRAGRAGYGGNAVNSMRQVLSPIVQRSVEGKTTGFKPDEIAAMREIVEGTPLTNALRLVGQASPSKGIIQSGLVGGGAVVAAGPAGLAIPAIGAASNKLATVLTGKQIERLNELVAKRSPAYAEAVQKSVDKFEQAQIALMNEPSPNRLAAFLSASRALSSGLQRDGVQISSGDLLRSIQGPMKSAAEDEQPAVPRRPGE